MNSRQYSGELWNVLVYAGAWGYPGCEESSEQPTPAVSTSKLIGIPYAGDNTGQNPNLRVIRFAVDTLDGPVRSLSTQGVQIVIFSSLITKIKWKLIPLGSKKPKNVNVGFYTSNYLSTSTDISFDRLIPLLSLDGPAFYKDIKGEFETTGFTSLYVIVDRKVSVQLKFSYRLPPSECPICFDELFKLYKYKICGPVVATEQLITVSPPTTLIRPSCKYINIGQEMISYLANRSVLVRIFDNTPAQQVGVKIIASTTYPNNQLGTYYAAFSMNSTNIDFWSATSTSPSGQFATENGRAYIVKQDLDDGLRASYILRITRMPSGNYTSTFYTRFVSLSNGGYQEVFGNIVPIPGAKNLSPGEYSFQYSIDPTEIVISNIAVQVLEKRISNDNQPISELPPSRIDSIDFTVVIL